VVGNADTVRDMKEQQTVSSKHPANTSFPSHSSAAPTKVGDGSVYFAYAEDSRVAASAVKKVAVRARPLQRAFLYSHVRRWFFRDDRERSASSALV